VLALTLVGGMRPLILVALIAALVVLEAAVDLRGAPAEPARSRPLLPHEVARRRGPG
jgi:hypothetical protein